MSLRVGTPRLARLLLLVSIGSSACAAPPHAGSGDDRAVRFPAVERFDSGFVLIDSVVLEQRPEAPIVRVSGLARRPDGVLALADASEGNVKLFAPDGRLLRVIGRKGQGPGEFLTPRYPVFHPDGRLLVADAQLGRVSVFGAADTVERTISLDAGFPLMGLHLLPDGRFVVAAPAAAAGRMLHLTDTAGRSLGGFLSSRQTRPRLTPELDQWKYLAGVFLAGRGRELVASFTLGDSLWFIDAQDSSSHAVRLEVPGYVEPTPPRQRIRTPQEIATWSRGFHTTTPPLLSDRLLLVSFVQGVLNYGDPMILAARLPDGSWHAFDGAPPPVLVSGDTVFTLLHTQESARMVLGLHRVRP